jgi:hypothetical protein
MKLAMTLVVGIVDGTAGKVPRLPRLQPRGRMRGLVWGCTTTNLETSFMHHSHCTLNLLNATKREAVLQHGDMADIVAVCCDFT